MIYERDMHPDLRAMFMANQPFEYAHLIKFERPSRPDNKSGKPSTSAVRYTYITDASHDIGFDDGSKDSDGVSNGTQTYLANKVIKVSEVSESVEAKASNFSLTVDGNGIGAEIGSQLMTVTVVSTGIYDIAIADANVDPVYEGFREGDKITLYGGQAGTFNIDTFRAGNVIRVRKIDTTLPAGTYTMGFRLDSEEIKSILLDKNSASYSSFINREVLIYKIYKQDGVTVGTPILLFRGIISNVSFDDGDNGIVVQWGLTSHWGDFAQVKGRITSDDFHRALDQNGNPQPESALKTIYAYDKGFMHAETSVNILATYVVQVEKQSIKSKRGFLGIGSKVKVKKYFVDESRHSQLDFQLAAKAIPLHYGVKVTSGIPIFADTLKSDAATVFVVYLLGEGPIGGIYDLYINGKSLICNDKADFDARSAQTVDNTVDVVCRGRADRGDVLGGTVSVNTVSEPNEYDDATNAYYEMGGILPPTAYYYSLYARGYFSDYVPATTTTFTSTGKGVISGESISLSSPIDMTMDFFGGTEGQEAASQLVEISKAGNFKIQSDYWTPTNLSSEYWGPNHILSDSAYVVCKYKIAEGETTIPDIEFIIRGKIIDCYNYDYSYSHSEKDTGESAANFALGSTVALKRHDTNATINASVQIIDKWEFTKEDGSVETRFRFSVAPALGYVDGVPTITKFYMQSGANKWTMTTFNYAIESGIVPTEISADVIPIDSGGYYTVPLPPSTDWNTGGSPGTSPIYSPPGSPTLVSGSKDGGFIQTKIQFGQIREQ